MRSLSLSARLTLAFAAITSACFILVGLLLYSAAAQRIHEQDETNLVLTARHVRRLVAELDSQADLKAHQDRLVVNVLGDNLNALRIVDGSGAVLVDHNPSGYVMSSQPVVPASTRIVPAMLQTWKDEHGATVCGIAVSGVLRDGAPVIIQVARSLADRQALLRRYGRDMSIRLLAGMIASLLLSYVLVRRALLPLSAMARDAAMINAQDLSLRLSAGKAPREFQALAVALNEMLGRLERGFDRVWQFTVDLAHDLRTPIGNLRGTNEVALSRLRSAREYQALLGSNIEECDRVSRTIENVLFLARAESPQFALQRTQFSIDDELQRIAEYFEGIAAEAGITILVSSSGRLSADRDLFRRAVGNLLSNALRYTPRGDAIRLISEQVRDEIKVVIENPGPGISAEHLQHVFDRFYRVDRSRSDSANSTGLGLSIVRSIMELHHGRVTAESQPGTLTRFTLWFPRESGA